MGVIEDHTARESYGFKLLFLNYLPSILAADKARSRIFLTQSTLYNRVLALREALAVK